MKRVCLGFCLALLAGCVNPYAKFYQPASQEVLQTVSARRVSPPPRTPELLRGNSPREDVEALAAEGYVVIGQSSFNGPKLDSDDALQQGQRVAADRVLVYGTLASTEHTVLPLRLPTTQTSVTNGTATAFGANGTATAYGSSTTTTYGTETTYIPMTVRRYDGLAIYLVKERYALGVRFRNLNGAESKAIGSVNGVVIAVVVRGSPAAAAGLLPDDAITAVDGNVVTDARQLNAYLAGRQGQAVSLAVVRNGSRMNVKVALGTY